MDATLILLELAATGLAATPLEAPKEPSQDKWAIGMNIEDVCYIRNRWEGPGATELGVYATDQDAPVIMFLTNYRWSATAGENLDLTIEFDKHAYPVKAKASSQQGLPGFYFALSTAMFNDLGKANVLRIRRGDAIIDELSLAGSMAVMEPFMHCIFVARPLARKKFQEQPHGNIPIDPFAKSAPVDK